MQFRGPARGELGAEHFLLLNPDAWLDAATARSLWERSIRDPMAAVSPVVRRPDGEVWYSKGSIAMRRGEVRQRSQADGHPPGSRARRC